MGTERRNGRGRAYLFHSSLQSVSLLNHFSWTRHAKIPPRAFFPLFFFFFSFVNHFLLRKREREGETPPVASLNTSLRIHKRDVTFYAKMLVHACNELLWRIYYTFSLGGWYLLKSRLWNISNSSKVVRQIWRDRCKWEIWIFRAVEKIFSTTTGDVRIFERGSIFTYPLSELRKNVSERNEACWIYPRFFLTKLQQFKQSNIFHPGCDFWFRGIISRNHLQNLAKKRGGGVQARRNCTVSGDDHDFWFRS